MLSLALFACTPLATPTVPDAVTPATEQPGARPGDTWVPDPRGGGDSGTAADPPAPADATWVTSLSRWDITWTFEDEVLAGTFANGDQWVVGPVSVTSITPATTVIGGRTLHGSMINPGVDCSQGYDSAMYGDYSWSGDYQDALNVAIGVSTSKPLLVLPGSSLISSRSEPDTSQFSKLRAVAILTVLDAVPPEGAFRPAYAGSRKDIRFLESDLDYDTLALLDPSAGAPSFPELTASFDRVWLDHCANWVSEFMHPSEHMPAYYRDFTALTGKAALLLNSDYPSVDKRDLLVGFVQRGIDDYGNLEAGAVWPVNGHNNGKKFPILFAGRVLGDQEMLDVGYDHAGVYFGPGDARNVPVTFSEDGQVFYVEETSPGTYNWGYGGYDSSLLGIADWGNYHTEWPETDSAGWDVNPYRRCCSANAWGGTTLAMEVMDLVEPYNNPAFFDYMDRYLSIEQPEDWTYSWDPWTGSMLQAHR